LGKTIEAGLVLCQLWSERKRKLLVICPASLRKQWALELSEKFNLPSQVIDETFARTRVEQVGGNPFELDSIAITSIHFASRHASEIRATQWDLVVIDEAHKLRNAYRESNRMGQNIRWALEDRRKLLLTATPLQNSLLELYGLSSVLDDHIFGDLPSFRTQYTGANGDLKGLRERLQSFSIRTLRRQVVEYIQYTERRLITKPFQPTDNEHKLYEAISAFLQRDGTYSLPQRQRHLTTLIVRKLLASSSQAVAGTLEAMRDRLVDLRDGHLKPQTLAEDLVTSEDVEDELLDEILDEEENAEEAGGGQLMGQPVDLAKLAAEIAELEDYIRWARSIGIDTKTRALLQALTIGFDKMKEIGGSQKAVIFTESRRTQHFLKDFLEANGYAGRIATFNGVNGEPYSTAIYQAWIKANEGTGRVSKSRPVDVRTAIIEHFRDNASILIATEAAAEGINLQFCSLVINYDLPWNPQRIEQRIGRCHRYGQKHDVVVINFLNERNQADQRVYELLTDKFTLFNGVFGVSDEVLGSLESGVDFEKRVFDIYQSCRTPDQISFAFQELQSELEEQIQSRLSDTRRSLLENFDEDVHARLKANLDGTREQLDRIGRMFWVVTKYILRDKARFDDRAFAFDLVQTPISAAKTGRYHLISKTGANQPGEYLYRLSHPLAEWTVEQARAHSTPVAKVDFDISSHPSHITIVENLKGQAGWLTLRRLTIDSFEREECLLFSAFTDSGVALEQETCEKLFHCFGKTADCKSLPDSAMRRLEDDADRHAKATIAKSLEQNSKYFNEAREKLEKWADDQVIAVERELKDVKDDIRYDNRQARIATTVEEQMKCQEKIRELEAKKRKLRQRIFDVEDEIMTKRDDLITALERRMSQRTSVEPLFTIRWSVV
jgi:superfamily II DNA or RNA helicase